MDTPQKQHRGFAAMSLEKRRELATKGGRAAQAKGTAHRWRTSEEARNARQKAVKSEVPDGAEG